MNNLKYKTEQCFFPNYLQSKHNHPKSFTKHTSKSVMKKENCTKIVKDTF